MVPRQAADEPDPGGLGHVADEVAETAQAVDRLAVELDAVSLADVGVQEVELVGADGLELPEGHDLDRPRDVAQEPAPRRLVPSEAGEGALELLVRRGHAVEHRGSLARGLGEAAGRAFAARHPRQDLPPVQIHELLREVQRVERERLRGVVASLDGQVGQRQEQRELVGGDEAPVGDEALDVEEELDLALGVGRGHHSPAR